MAHTWEFHALFLLIFSVWVHNWLLGRSKEREKNVLYSPNVIYVKYTGNEEKYQMNRHRNNQNQFYICFPNFFFHTEKKNCTHWKPIISHNSINVYLNFVNAVFDLSSKLHLPSSLPFTSRLCAIGIIFHNVFLSYIYAHLQIIFHHLY